MQRTILVAMAHSGILRIATNGALRVAWPLSCDRLSPSYYRRVKSSPMVEEIHASFVDI